MLLTVLERNGVNVFSTDSDILSPILVLAKQTGNW